MPGKPKIAVFSCYFGAHEPLNQTATGEGGDCDRFLFTDDPSHDVPGVEKIHLPDHGLGPAYLSRQPKIKPHLFFSDYDWVIYVDNRARLNQEASKVAEHALNVCPSEDELSAGRYLIPHRRDCVYTELRAAKRRGLMPGSDVATLRTLYRERGLPDHFGLFKNTIMIQKMGSPETDKMNELWWDLFLRYGKRDQVTLPYAVWVTGCPFKLLPSKIGDFVEWPVYGRKARAQFRGAQGAS